MQSKHIVGAGLVAATMLVFAGTSQAALIDCPASFVAPGTAKVNDGGTPPLTAVSDCQYLSPADPSNVGSIANINSAEFFGFDDWAGNGQTQIDTENMSSGTWSINGVDFAAFDYIMVFKSGQGTNLTAFSFNETANSGNWSTPFTEPPFSFPGATTSRDVSHYTIARRSTSASVPEPGSLALLGFGLIGIGLMRRFRHSAA